MIFIRQFFRYIRNIYNKQELSQRASIVLLFFNIACFIYIGPGEPDGGYRVLFSNLIEKDALAISEVLAEKGIDYKLESEGSAILVPKGLEKELRLEVICHLGTYFSKPYEKISSVN